MCNKYRDILNTLNVGKGSLMCTHFWPPCSAPWEWAVGLEHFLTEIKSPHNLFWTSHLVWDFLSLFQTQHLFLCSAWVCVSYDTWPTPLLHPLVGRRQGPSAAAQEGCMRASCATLAAERTLLAIGDWCSQLDLMLLFLLYGNKALFHRVLDCVVFPWLFWYQESAQMSPPDDR